MSDSENTKGMRISSFFYKGEGNPLEDPKVLWETRITELTGRDGRVVYSNRAKGGFEVPASWSVRAGDIMAEKYAVQAGAGLLPGGRESSAKQVISRVADKITMWGTDHHYFATPEDGATFRNELAWLLLNQYGAFNSPVWFNVGKNLWGCQGPGGSYAWNTEYDTHPGNGGVFETQDAFSRPQGSACFILSREDDLMDIFQGVKDEARLFRSGSGAGSNFSKIRGKDEALRGGGKSSGLLSFLKVYDSGAGATKSGGVTRRAAKMVCLDMDHPDIVPFIRWKANEEKKIQILINNGIGLDSTGRPDFNGEAHETVGGQNSNNSVRVTDAFLARVKGNLSWETRLRTTGEVKETLPAVQIWHEIAEAAWTCGDPGVQYEDTIQKWHTCKTTGPIRASNPCSEFMFLDDTACNLASLNLLKFKNDNQGFDTLAFLNAARIFLIAQEILVDLSSYPTAAIAKNSHDFRPLGLGYANLGTLLMMMGIPYDSDEGRYVAACITAMMTGQAYVTSADLAREMGPFAGFSVNRDSMLDVIANHKVEADKLYAKSSHDYGKKWSLLAHEAKELWYTALILGNSYGYRNAQVTVIAPTGTIGFLMDCETTGIEPAYGLKVYKLYAGGQMRQIVNEAVGPALKNLGYDDPAIQTILTGLNEFRTLVGFIDERHLPVFDCASEDSMGRYLLPMSHILMMAATQPFLSGAISKTVNLPNSATVEDIEDIYMKGAELGLKAVALYRDGCKTSQPLTTEKKEEKAAEPLPTNANRVLKVGTGSRERMENRAKADRYKVIVGGQKLYIHVGLSPDGKPLEVFVRGMKMGGALVALVDSFCIAVSFALQYGAPLSELVDAFTYIRFEPSGVVEGHDGPHQIKLASSIIDFIFRLLGVEYLGMSEMAHLHAEKEEDEELPMAVGMDTPQKVRSIFSDAPFCSNCGFLTTRNGSCYRCARCGNSEGCS